MGSILLTDRGLPSPIWGTSITDGIRKALAPPVGMLENPEKSC